MKIKGKRTGSTPAQASAEVGLEEYSAMLADIVREMPKPEEYVRRVVENYYLYAFDRRKAVTRLGMAPKGSFHYRIEETGTAPVEGSDPQTSTRPKRSVFDGRTHQKITEELVMGKSWSSRSTTFEEISELLGQLRRNLK